MSPDGVEEVWVLKRVEVLKAPDWEGLEELECFALSFEREEVRTEVGQGVFRLDDGEGFGEELFVVRGMGSLMEVTVN